MTATRQLALPFIHTPRYEAADFLADPSNEAAQRWLAETAWPQGRLAIWGPAGCGKTHLLQVWAERQGARLLSGPMLRLQPPAGPVAVDDADTAPERPLLHLLNAAAEAGYPMVIVGRSPPARWPVALPDLASRLRAMPAVEIEAADDELLRALLARLLVARQVAVAEPVQDWLRLRLPRSAAAMREAAARLDHLALADGGRVTRTTAARVVADLTETDEDMAPHEDFIQPQRQGESGALLL